MKIENYINDLRNQEIFLTVRDGELKIKAKREQLTKFLLAELTARKGEILDFYNTFDRAAGYSPIGRVGEKPYYVLSSAQKRLYFIQEFDKSSMAYNMPQVVQLEGALDKEKLEAAFGKLLARHESLRTCFRIVGQEVVQIVQDAIDFKVEYFEAAPSGAGAVIHAFVRPFDLSEGPLIRVGLIGLGGERYLMLVDLHHIITDGVSQGTLINDFVAFYAGQELPALHLQYKDYAEWQQGEDQRLKLAAQGRFWRDQFVETTLLDLPTDFARPAVKEYKGASCGFTLGRESVAGLKALAEGAGATMFMTVLSVFKVLLHKLSNQEDIVIGTPVAGRDHADLQGIVGVFINTLAIRNAVDAALPFEAFLEKVKEKCLACFDNQSYPYEELIEALNVPRDLGRNPLFDVMYMFQNFDPHDLSIPGLKLSPYEAGHQVANFDLTLTATEFGGELQLYFNYSTSLFERSTVERFIAYFEKIVAEVVASPGKTIAEIDVVPADESRKLLAAFNDTARTHPNTGTISQRFDAQAGQTPDKVALVAGDESLTYRELQVRIDALAGLLARRGVKANDVVAIMCDRSAALITAMFAVLKSGAAYLPIDPHHPGKRIEQVLKDSGAVLILADHPRQEGSTAHVEAIDVRAAAGVAAQPAGPGAQTDPGDLAYVIYTSGSTGQPKGVMISHKALGNFVDAIGDLVSFRDKTLLSVTTFSFDIFVLESILPLLGGGTIVLATNDQQRDPSALNAAIFNHGVNIVQSTPSLMKAWMEEPETRHALAQLSLILIGGEAFPVSLLKALQNQTRARILNMYGPTETTVWSTAHELTGSDRVVIGKPIANTSVLILDGHGKLQPIGVTGELCIAGAGLSKGYINNDALTGQKFVPHPFEAGAKLYKTGDLARWLPDGTLQHLGRLDHQVKIRGFRIELEEIQGHLLLHPGVKDAVVTVKEVNGEKNLIGYYTAGEPVPAAELRTFLSAHLPEYMIPLYYAFLREIPVNANGKVNLKALPDPQLTLPQAYVAPATEVQQKLAAIWSEVLKLEQDKISVTADFFELGGHSLKAIKLVNQLAKYFDVEVPLAQVFAHPTILALSDYLAQAQTTVHAGIRKAPPLEYYPLSSAQGRMHFLHELNTTSLAYNMPEVLHLEGPLDRQRVEDTFRLLIARHESLRTRFVSLPQGAFQQVLPQADFHLEYFPDGEQSGQQHQQSIIAAFIRPFRLGEAPLLRAALVALSADEHLLLVDMHHIITDGVSQSLLIGDFMRLYSGESLPALPLQYKDYAYWQQSPRHQQARQAMARFWTAQFESPLAPLQLPADFARPSVRNYQGANHSFLLDAHQTQGLKDLSQQTGATLFMTVLAVFNVLLGKLSGQDDIVVGTQVAGREHADLESIMGVFLNTLPLRNQPRGQLSFGQFLQQVRQQTLTCLSHQAYPYEQLIEQLDLPRQASRNPLFDVQFMFQNFESEELRIPGLKLKPHGAVHPYAKLDLTLTASEWQGQLYCNFEYSTELFKAATIESFVACFQHLVSQLTERPHQPMGSLSLVDAREQQRLLAFNETASPYPSDRSLVDLFEHQVRRRGAAPAVSMGGQSLSYDQLNGRANQLARYLAGQGVVPGSVVALLVDRSLEMITAMLAVLKAGAGYLPIDPTLPRQRVAYMLDQSRSSLLLSEPAYLETYSAYLPAKDLTSEQLYQSDAPQAGRQDLALRIEPSSLAYCIFTSGSTGQPKGVLMNHRSVVNLVHGLQQRVYHPCERPLRVGLLASYSFDASVQQIFGALLQGHTLVICEEAQRKDGQGLLSFYNDQAIDLSDGTPTHLSLLVNCLQQKAAGANGQETTEKALRTLSSWILAGEVLDKELVRTFLRLNGPDRVRLFNFYGPTETCVDSTGFLIDPDTLDAYHTIPIGKPLPNERVYLTDAYGQLVPVGVAGELCIAGDGLAQRYTGDASLTTERFVSGWVAGEQRVYRTGDMARWLPDGNLEYLGRKDMQVKLRGYRIELREIEVQLMTFEGVKSAVVHLRKVREEDCLVAYYTSDGHLEVAALRTHLGQYLPEYMIPSFFVHLDARPLTVNGKIDHEALSALEPVVPQEYKAPSSPVEEQLREIWASVLKLKKEAISVESNFFEVGGHSLKAIQVVNSIKQTFSVSLKIGDVFTHPRIEQQAKLIEMEQWLSKEGNAAPAPKKNSVVI